jgi:2'-5' RNA ligase
MYYRYYSTEHNLHLTIISVDVNELIKLKQRTIEEEFICCQTKQLFPYVAKGIGLATFGPPEKRVRVVKVKYDSILESDRIWAENLLKKHGVRWRTDYKFVPHVTVEDGKFREEITFTHLGWDLTSIT